MLSPTILNDGHAEVLVMLAVFGPDSVLEILVVAINIEKQPHNKILRWRDTKINDIHDFTGYCYFHDKTELGGCFLHSVLLALSLGPD